MAMWETEDERSGPARPVLSTAMDAQRPRSSRTPSRGSKRSRRSVTPPGKISSSPPPMPGSDKTDKSDRVSKDFATDHNISILDPRRFTPTLHANLVSEILNLRRDQEEKLKVIESLESTLQTTREEEDSIQTTLVSTAKENRSLKRQLALLEGGTSSALGELARERDEAVETAAESKKRLEAAQKKLKTQEDDSGRTHDQWAKEKDDWDEERRKMERKLHVAETRLKTILEEVAAFHDAQANAEEESGGEDKGKDKDSDAGSVRSMSIRESLRFSLMNKANGYSLADELDFDDDSDYQTDPNGRDSVMSARKHARNDSRTSIMSKSHRRHRSSESFIRPGSVARGKFQPQMQGEGNLANGIIQEIEEPPSPAHPKSTVSYTDTGVQFSPPPSPKLQPSKSSIPEPTGVTALAARWEKQHHEAEATEANQRRKRVAAASRPQSIQAAVPQSLMVSASAQTMDIPMSPPKTPKFEPLEQMPTPKPKSADMISAATQTDTPVPPALLRPATPPTPAIPSIAIHPPKSRPSTPKKSLLPQLFKDFGCQVSLSNVPMSSSGVQTEEIRIDQRLDRLPAHLHPSAINSRPTSPAQGTEIPNDPDRHFTPVPGNLPPRNPRRLTSQRSIGELATSARMSIESETKDAYPGNNDDGPVSQKAAVRRPHRISSLFAGFDAVSSADEADDFADADMSDTEYRTALSAPRPVKTPEPGRSTPGSIPSSPEEVAPKKSAHKFPARQTGKNEIPISPRLADSPEGFGPTTKGSKGHIRGSGMGGKSGGMRKAAMIQNGITTHQEDAKDPPFPIPTRASSRKPLNNGSAPSDGNRSPTRNEPWRKNRMPLHRANSLRKSRSGATGSGKSRSRRQNSRSPPYTPDLNDPSVPPLPRNQLTTPKNDRGRGRGHSHQPSTNTATTEATGFQSNASSQPAANTVVDAIAQTMVGEWMFKYVRRRKSFGVATDNVAKDDSSNDRHKRWVWLAPYERAILWSSKQPSSGSALLGKSGRKRRLLALLDKFHPADSAPVTIQSVLDVKDDNPPPKGHTVVFNRSILILTPQRALKFTAVNAERHYLWLTSLSFLAHSQQQVPDLPAPPMPAPAKTPDFDIPPSKAKSRRPRIRDSIRLAKGHNANITANNAAAAHPSGGSGGVMTSQLTNGGHQPAPMPSIPDVPSTLVPGYRSPPPPAASESVASGYSNPSNPSNHTNPGQHSRDWSSDAAEPPFIPRFQDRDRAQVGGGGVIHGRKRSNTGGHVPPPLSFRGFSGPTSYHAPTNSQSTGTGSSEVYSNPSNNSHSTPYSGPASAGLSSQGWGGMSVVSGRTSEASNRTSGANFFDAIGTVRMEAFISPLAFSQFGAEGDNGAGSVGGANFPDPLEDSRYRARRRSKEIRRRRSRSRQRDSYSSRGARSDYYSGSRTAGEEEYTRDDPFKGF